MRVTLVQIGNSKGIRLPTSILRQCGFGEALDLRVENGSVVLTPAPAVRADWDTAFAAMAAAGDDAPIWPEESADGARSSPDGG